MFIIYIEVKHNNNRTKDGRRFLRDIQSGIISFEGGL